MTIPFYFSVYSWLHRAMIANASPHVYGPPSSAHLQTLKLHYGNVQIKYPSPNDNATFLVPMFGAGKLYFTRFPQNTMHFHCGNRLITLVSQITAGRSNPTTRYPSTRETGQVSHHPRQASIKNIFYIYMIKNKISARLKLQLLCCIALCI